MSAEWVSIQEGARRLGISEGAARKRVDRGSLPSIHGDDGRVYVRVEYGQTGGESEAGEGPALVGELRDRVRFLERQLETRDEEIRRRDHIIASLVQSVPELPAPDPSNRENSPPNFDEESPSGGGVEEETTTGSQRPQQHRRAWWRRLLDW